VYALIGLCGEAKEHFGARTRNAIEFNC